MAAYYNENDANAAAWLRELIKENLIAPGDVDERSIEDVAPEDLKGYDQCHFFAGIGGWSLGLRLAGWPDNRPVWTGSCPCQPFSQAGAGKGTDDPRHLWPIWRWLVDQCRPAVVFGEQVASPAGRKWLAGVRTDLEALGYGVGAADLCAAGLGAPHIRQRLWWMADSGRIESRQRGVARSEEEEARDESGSGSGVCGEFGWLGNADSKRAGRDARAVSQTQGEASMRPVGDGAISTGAARRMGDTVQPGLEGYAGHESDRNEPGRQQAPPGRPAAQAGSNSWDAAVWIACGDGKARRIEPGLEPLVDGLPGRVGLLRGYGNAIVPQLAAIFIEATMT